MRFPEDARRTIEDVRLCIKDDEPYPTCRMSISVMCNANVRPKSSGKSMPVVKGRIGVADVEVLRGTECSEGVVVTKIFWTAGTLGTKYGRV